MLGYISCRNFLLVGTILCQFVFLLAVVACVTMFDHNDNWYNDNYPV